MNNNLFDDIFFNRSFIRSTLLVYLLWPLAGLYFALRNFRNDWSKNIFWLFCVYFGYTFIIAQNDSNDSYYYAQVFIQYTHSKLNLKELWSSFYSDSSGYVDIASPLISFLLSCITANPRILFLVFGLIFGYFYSRNVWFVLDHINGNFTTLTFLFIVTFSLLIPIWNIFGFRMWTAAQIFLFGTLPYLLDGNRKRLLWSVTSVFFHFSFLFPLGILFLFISMRNRLNIYMGFFILTSLINEIDLQVVRSALSFLPNIYQPRILGYTNFEYVEEIRNMAQSLNWYVLFSLVGIKWVTYTMTLYIFLFCRKLLKSRSDLLTLFCFSLLLYGCANIAGQIPSGDRFLIVATTFMFVLFAIFVSAFPKIRGLLFIKTISIPMLLLFFVVTIRTGMDFFSITTILGNPFIVSFYSDTIPFITRIKELLP